MKRYILSTTQKTEGYVSIWWYDDVQNEIIGGKCLLSEGVDDRGYIQYSSTENHMSMWKYVVLQEINDADRQSELLSRGFRSLERGRVVYEIKTQCYQIVCSSSISTNKEVIRKIAEECNLLDKHVEIITSIHYDNEMTDMQELFLRND